MKCLSRSCLVMVMVMVYLSADLSCSLVDAKRGVSQKVVPNHLRVSCDGRWWSAIFLTKVCDVRFGFFVMESKKIIPFVPGGIHDSRSFRIRRSRILTRTHNPILVRLGQPEMSNSRELENRACAQSLVEYAIFGGLGLFTLESGFARIKE